MEGHDGISAGTKKGRPSTKRPFDHVHELLKLWKQKRPMDVCQSQEQELKDLACKICTLLLKTNSFETLAVFLETLTDVPRFGEEESIVRARVHLALHLKDTEAVYKLLKVIFLS